MQPSQPEELEWVKIRGTCTLAHVFESLALQIRKDVDEINALRPRKFELSKNGSYIVVFQKDTHDLRRSITFSCTPTSIRVTNGDEQLMMEATLVMNDDGKCCLKVGDKQRYTWQFRKDALEGLFFGDGWFQ